MFGLFSMCISMQPSSKQHEHSVNALDNTQKTKIIWYWSVLGGFRYLMQYYIKCYSCPLNKSLKKAFQNLALFYKLPTSIISDVRLYVLKETNLNLRMKLSQIYLTKYN